VSAPWLKDQYLKCWPRKTVLIIEMSVKLLVDVTLGSVYDRLVFQGSGINSVGS
jgi:hypothetical protein